jgi:hypothetical protein
VEKEGLGSELQLIFILKLEQGVQIAVKKQASVHPAQVCRPQGQLNRILSASVHRSVGRGLTKPLKPNASINASQWHNVFLL